MLTFILLLALILTAIFPEKIIELNLNINVLICFFGFLIAGILSYNLDTNKRIETVLNSIIYSLFNFDNDNSDKKNGEVNKTEN